MDIARALVRDEDGVRGLVVDNTVYDPLVFSPRLVKFTSKQYVFLKNFRFGVPIEEAATKAGMTPEQAHRFLAKDDTRAWLADRAEKDHIKNEWQESAKWWQVGQSWLDAPPEAKPNKNEVEIWKEFGRRVEPIRPESSGDKIEIHIDPAAVKEAFRRKEAIDAQIVQEQSGGSLPA